MEELHELARRNGAEYLVDSFPAVFIDRWLKRSTPESVFNKMQRSQRALEELRAMEKKADANILKAFFDRGEVCVRGYDKMGRAIMWGRHPKNALKIRAPYTEACLYHIWFYILNCRRRRDPNMTSLVIYNEFDRKLLDTNFYFAAELFRLAGELAVDEVNANGRVFIPSPLFATIGRLAAELLCRIRGSGESNVQLLSDREAYVHELEDASDVPENFLPSGRPFDLSFEVAGNWRDLIEKKNAFENMTLKDIFNPDPAAFNALRVRVEEEEQKLAASGEENSPDHLLREKSTESSDESSEQDQDDYSNTGEFLM